MDILVSVTCTTFNHEKFIAKAIESFLMQITNFPYEILIGEDCSTDQTRSIVDEYVKKHPDKIRLITSENNVGARKNSIRLVNASSGKYIAECEGDDYWTDPYKLQRQVDYMEANPDCSMCFHSAQIVHESEKPTGRGIRPYKKNQISPIQDIILGGGGFCPTPSLFYRRALMQNPPDYYLSAPVGDYPMQMYLASEGSVYYMDKCMCAYRIGVDGSWTHRISFGKDIRQKIAEVNEGIIQLLDGFNQSTNGNFEKEVEKVREKLTFELLLLTRNKKEQRKFQFKKYNLLTKAKIKLKIFIRCSYPHIFLMISNLKTKRIKMNLYG